jgi:hypothetical protein
MTIHPQRRPKRRNGDKKEWPKMLYDAQGNGKVFQSEADVPEGYAPLGEEPTAAPEPKQESPNPNKGLAKALGLKKQEIIAALTEAEIEFPANASVDDLAAIYQEAAEAADDDDDEE